MRGPGLACLALLGACTHVPPLPPEPPAGLAELDGPAVAGVAPAPVPAGDAIVAAGERFATGTRVVLWTEEPRYDGYSTALRFGDGGAQPPSGLRYQPGRTPRSPELAARVRREGWTLDNLRRQVDQLVLHYDACGTSRECFRVLHDRRGLSVHFLLDVDGTIYQTLDLAEQAWHARQANPRSVGIEIAHVGAYPAGSASPADAWYEPDGDHARLRLPPELGDGGVRTPGFVGRSARPRAVVGGLQGQRLRQYDFTPEQYEALSRLTATLARALPGIRLEAPRDAAGRIPTSVLSEEAWSAFGGVLGHYHVSASKVDPGPAFQWERLLRGARAAAAAP